MVWIDGIGEIEEVDDSDRPEPPKITEPEYSDSLIAVYTAFREQVHDAKSVLHPSCGFDASPAKVFPNVTFVDKEDGCEGAMEVFRKHGLNAFKQDIRDYKPTEEHDLLILLNPAIQTEWAARHLQKGGYVLSNNYHRNASWMHSQPESFELWGTIDFVERNRRKGDNRVVVSRNLEGLFEPVESGEELKILRPQHYEFIMKSYPHLLKSMGIEPEKTFEKLYVQFSRMMDESETFPAKKTADWYAFVKK